MQRKSFLLVLLLAAAIGVIASFFLSITPIQKSETPAAKPEKNSRQADTPLSKILGEIELPGNSAAKKDPRLNNVQLQRHLEMRGRSVESLLAASRFKRRLQTSDVFHLTGIVVFKGCERLLGPTWI